MIGREPVAIIGIGCRLPGAITDPTSLWDVLTEGVDAITTIPPDRFDVEGLYDERPATPGRVMSRFGGFVDGIDEIDARFFELSPREAERLDPQQRLLLETVWEALEDAGIGRERIGGTTAGVYVGMWLNEYESRLFANPDLIDFHMTTGAGRYAASGRISYFLDLLGPSVTVDTACSSSLVAVHLACQALAAGECDLVLAGGANAIIEPHVTIAFSQSRMMTPEGRCKFGDASANGFVRSDGAVMLALKRLSSAQADGDHVYAVIRGSAVTNDGRSSGFLATPGQAGQEEMLRRAYADAGVDPRTVHYVEAHGTGTSAGDPVELGAIGAVIGAVPGRSEPLLVGSIKSNIGHCEGAAGAAGLAKLALAVEHADIPASLHVNEPNPTISWDELRVQVPRQRQPWPASGGPRRGGVSAFGITGTNAHVVVEEAPPATASPAIVPANDPSAFALPIAASGRSALRALGERYLALLDDDGISIGDLCAAAATKRSHLADRVVVVGRDRVELAGSLQRRLAGLEAEPAASATAPSVVFVFPGQGSQWLGMARQLLAEEPAFANALRTCDGAIRHETGWSPIDMLTATDPGPRIDDIDVVQPLLFAIQVSLAVLWRSWGIVPDAVVGHSMGEVAAAHVAGALELADAVAVICRRSTLLRRIAGQGAMALVDLDVAAAAAALAGYESRLSVAVSNSPRSTVLSGDPVALRDVLDRLETQDVFCRPVKVDVASHSPQVDPLLPDLRAALVGLAPRAAALPFFSTVVGEVLDRATLDAEYWAANLRQPVLFGAAVAALAAKGPTAFVELSPHPVLLPSIEQVLNDAGDEGLAVASMRRNEPERATMLRALGALYEAGATVEWDAVTGQPLDRVVLPTYPWQRERHWYEPVRSSGRSGGHPLLGHALRPAGEAGTVHWQTTLDGDGLAFLREHVVQGSAILPGTGFVELGRAAAGPGAGLTDLVLREALPLDPEHPRDVQVTVDGSVSPARCQVWSREAPDGEWQLHAEMRVEPGATLAGDGALDDIRRRCPEHRDGATHAADIRGRGLDYGESFRLVRDIWVGDGEAVGHVDASALRAGSADRRIAALDSCWQVALSALPRRLRGQTFIPVGADRVVVGDLDDVMWSHARVDADEDGAVRCDLRVLRADGVVVAVTDGLELRRVDGQRGLDPLVHELQWRPAPLPATGPAAERRSWVVYATDELGGDLADRLRAGGDDCVVVPLGTTADPVAVLRDAIARQRAPLAGVVYAWASALPVPAATSCALTGAEETAVLTPVSLIRACSALDSPLPRVYLVTRGASAAAPTQALLWGLGRVAANEQPALRCTLVDLGTDADERTLFDEVRSGAPDDQVAYRDGARTVARLVPSPDPSRGAAPRTAPADAYRLAATTPGSLDSLRPVVQPRTAPGPGEVEVRVGAAALNFLDVLKAMGIYPGYEPTPDVALGAEAAGVVVAVGAGVEHVRVGDAVVAITPSYRHTSMMASYVTVPAGFVLPRPPGLSVEEASALPVAYVTAYHTLCELGQVRAGEQVLIHAATGGVGLAAIAICRLLGAGVVATAGSEHKRAHLRSLGIEHVLDSRTLDFAREVLDITGGRGVDVVLNSLTGDAIPAGLSVLAPRGRFLEIGKRDVYGGATLDLSPFRNNLSLCVVDMAAITEQDPDYLAGLFREVMARVADGRLPPLPVSTLPMAAAVDAYRQMAQAGHIGKIVLTVDAAPLAADSPPVRPDGTYLVTGGTRRTRSRRRRTARRSRGPAPCTARPERPGSGGREGGRRPAGARSGGPGGPRRRRRRP